MDLWTGCFVWLGSDGGKDGYAKFKPNRDGPMVNASRVAWELTFGEIPKGLEVLHSCDNRLCVNPEHMRLGTHRENMQDCIRKGRFYFNKDGRRGKK